MKIEKILRNIFYDVSNPASFSSVDKLYREAQSHEPLITRRDVEEFLSAQLAYTLHRKAVRKFKRNPVVANFHSEQAQADLIDVTRYSEANEQINYILTLIDVFSKLAFAVPVARKSGPLIAEALSSIFKRYIPSNLQTDEGKEFINANVQNLLRDNSVNFFLAKNERIKCAVVERFQRTLMTKMQKYFTAKGTTRWFDILDQLITTYNNSYHRSIKMTPVQATKANRQIVFRNLYGHSSEREILKTSLQQCFPAKAKDTVRIQAQKDRFAKGYAPNFTDEIYQIKHLSTTYHRPVFKLQSLDGKEIPGSFYPEEIQKIKDTNIYRVQVLDKRRRGRGWQYLVKYVNFDRLAPQWIPGSQLNK